MTLASFLFCILWQVPDLVVPELGTFPDLGPRKQDRSAQETMDLRKLLSPISQNHARWLRTESPKSDTNVVMDDDDGLIYVGEKGLYTSSEHLLS